MHLQKKLENINTLMRDQFFMDAKILTFKYSNFFSEISCTIYICVSQYNDIFHVYLHSEFFRWFHTLDSFFFRIRIWYDIRFVLFHYSHAESKRKFKFESWILKVLILIENSSYYLFTKRLKNERFLSNARYFWMIRRSCYTPLQK